MKLLRKWRITLGGVMVLIAVIAVGLAWLRGRTTRVVDVWWGSGPAVKAGDTVDVHYVGRFASGRQFDSSWGRGQPFSFQVGRGHVIKGWDQGVIGMRTGGVRWLIIPPEEAYGARGAGGIIPPNSTLVFTIRLIGIR